jgi:tetratricopeptide (TPR) repeat protein
MRRYQREIIIFLTLTLAVIIVFGQIRHHEFVNFDDPDYITENLYVRDGWSLDGVKWAFTTRLHKHWHPVTWLSHMTDVEVFGVNPRGHHLVSLLIHLLNTLLLFWVLRRMTDKIWQSAFVAALFALHPLHVEPVAWVADRKDLLCALAWILAMWAYVGYAARPAIGRYLIVMVLFVVGLMAKPMMVTLPVVLILLDYWPLSRLKISPVDPPTISPVSGQVSIERAVVEKAGFFIFILISALVTIYAMQGIGGIDIYGSWTSGKKVAVSLVSYVVYLHKALWPSGLAVSYPVVSDVPMWQALGAALLLAAVTAAVVRWGRRCPYLPVGWFWYLITLLPVIGLVQFGPSRMADRYTYLPLIGIFIMVAWGVVDLVVRVSSRKKLLVVMAAGTIAACMIASIAQTAHWKDSYTLFSHSVKVAPQNSWVQHNYGAAAMERGRWDEAMQAFEEVLRLDPRDTAARNQLGILLSKKGRPEEALAVFRKALELDPRDAEIAYNMGLCLLQLGKKAEAREQFEHSLRISPNNEGGQNMLGVLLTEEQEYEEARSHFREAIRIAPHRPAGEYNMGLSYLQEGNIEAAKTHFSRALEIDPNHSKAHLYLGKLLVREKDLDGALAHFNEVLRLNPEDAEAQHAVGTILYDKGQMETAKRYLTRAVDLNPDNAEAKRLLVQIDAGKTAGNASAAEPGKTVVATPDDPQGFYQVGMLLLRNGRMEEAREAFENLLRDDPRHTGANYHLGVIAARQGRLDAAVQYFSTALENDPDDPQLHNNLGAVLAQQGRWDRAIDHFSEALRINPDDVKAKQNLTLARQMKASAQKGD